MRVIWMVLAEHRDLRLLLTAGLVSQTGDWVLRVGLAYYVYVLTGSTRASAAMLLASFVPQMVLGSVAGVFVDRWDRRHTMIVSNLLLALGLLPLLLATSSDRVWVIYLVLFWEGCVQQFFIPAEQSLIPRLVPGERLVTANALAGQIRDIARLLGSALGGVVIALGGITLLTLVDIATFLLSAGLIRWLRTHGTIATPKAEAAGARLGHRLHALRRDWVSGLRLASHEHTLRVVMIFLLTTTIGEGIMSTLFAPFVRDALHGTSGQYGLIVSVQAIGGIAGGLLAAGLGDRLRPGPLLGWGAVAFGAIDLTMFLYPLWYPAVWPALACMIAVGLPGAFMTAGAMTLLQQHATESHRGRVFGALGAIEGVSIVAGTVAAGILGDQVGIIPVLTAQGAGYLIAGLAVIVKLRPERVTPQAESTAKVPG